MARVLWWSFGEPREERGELVADFYYLPGKHVTLRMPWPAGRFEAAGTLSFRINDDDRGNGWGTDLIAPTEKTGHRLYQILGPEAQTTLIRFFSNLQEDSHDRIVFFQFLPPAGENRERCLALEDLPWELLHDGEEYIARRYSLQIVRTHIREDFIGRGAPLEVSSWGILLVSPFVFSSEEECRQNGLAPLPQGIEEARALRNLEKETHGLVRVRPQSPSGLPGGITTLSDLEKALQSKHGEPFHLIHYVGHGVLYDDEPCLCFQKPGGGIDYVSVERLHRLFLSVRNAGGTQQWPSVLFLNACSSSNRGRYSAGFASGLHELGMCVLGYQSEIRDDEKPRSAALSFYRSLCMDQSLQYPHRSPNLVAALTAAREGLRAQAKESEPVWGTFRAYLPVELSFTVLGRGFVERVIQKQYARLAQGMDPTDYMDHLSIGLLLAIIFGVFLGADNLFLIIPKSVLPTHLTYHEILSDLLRIFLIGPFSLLAASFFVAWQTRRNYRFLNPQAGHDAPLSPFAFHVGSLPIHLAAGISFMLLFSFLFTRLDLLTAQTAEPATRTTWPISVFWFVFNAALVLLSTASLWIATRISIHHRPTLHSYRTYYLLTVLFIGLTLLYVSLLENGTIGNHILIAAWFAGIGATWLAYAFAVTKILKEIAWRASRKIKTGASFSWSKLFPLLVGGVFAILFYFFLEESVRFETQTIFTALNARGATLADARAETGDSQNERIIERALRQRALPDIPDRVRMRAEQDWLLGVVYADYLLYQAQIEENPDQQREFLRECGEALEASRRNHAELQFKDYYCNIYAMFKILSADLTTDRQIQQADYEEAMKNAEFAVQKEEMNFAYLDTLARAEAQLGTLIRNPELLHRAAGHVRKAAWSAFFLRSSRAKEVQYSIRSLEETIEKNLAEMNREKKSNG